MCAQPPPANAPRLLQAPIATLPCQISCRGSSDSVGGWVARSKARSFSLSDMELRGTEVTFWELPLSLSCESHFEFLLAMLWRRYESLRGKHFPLRNPSLPAPGLCTSEGSEQALKPRSPSSVDLAMSCVAWAPVAHAVPRTSRLLGSAFPRSVAQLPLCTS